MSEGTYIEVDFTIEPLDPGRDILLAQLGELPFESFVETESGLRAYLLRKDWTRSVKDEIHRLKNDFFNFHFTEKEIVQENWNAKWESSFEPIHIDKRCCIRAPFHEKSDFELDIIIEPKMSFGTGHHETTGMMVQQMLEMDFQDKSVLDMGCGTGVLAIVAEKLGAISVDAIDIDSWCYENTMENIERNSCSKISAFHGGSELFGGKTYDIILANINRNILIEQMESYVESLTPRGSVVLSGFYDDDLPIISNVCKSLGLKQGKVLSKNNWQSVVFLLKTQ